MVKELRVEKVSNRYCVMKKSSRLFCYRTEIEANLKLEKLQPSVAEEKPKRKKSKKVKVKLEEPVETVDSKEEE